VVRTGAGPAPGAFMERRGQIRYADPNFIGFPDDERAKSHPQRIGLRIAAERRSHLPARTGKARPCGTCDPQPRPDAAPASCAKGQTKRRSAARVLCVRGRAGDTMMKLTGWRRKSARAMRLVATFAALIAATPALSEQSDKQTDKTKASGPLIAPVDASDGTRAGWEDYRRELEEGGITLLLDYTGEVFSGCRLNPSGTPRYRGLVNLSLRFATEKLGLWPKGELFINGQNGHGQGIDVNPAGVALPISNIDAQDFTQISEYGLQQNLLDGRVRIVLGKKDVNTIFCVSNFGSFLVNPSYALIPTVPMPTFPAPALGGAVLTEPADWLSLGMGVYDGAPKIESLGFDTAFDGKGGYFYVFEPAWKPAFGSRGQDPGNYRLGLWYHSGDVSETGFNTEPKIFSSNHGYYLLIDQTIYKEQEGVGDGRTLGLFFQLGWAPSDRNEVYRYVGGGLSCTGVVPKRDQDTLGIGVSQMRLIGSQGPGQRVGLTNVEVYYLAQLTPWLRLQPDVQYFDDPQERRRDGLAFGLRWLVKF
jgi:porin